MARGEMLTVFAYDISENKRRRRMAALLEKVATRVQGSVFEAYLSRAKTLSISQRAAAHLGDGDSLRVYAIGANGMERSRSYGDGPPLEPEPDYWIV